MLITELKTKEALSQLVTGKVFIINCHGCREVHFPVQAAEKFENDLLSAGKAVGIITTDYICNPENLRLRLERRSAMLEEADAVLVLSCGVGVQTVTDVLPGKRVYAGCDTYRLPGFQGVTPLEVNCDQCGECFLNLTGGICPITACSKGLVNGQCGGAKNGKCEVDQNMPCGWERIYRRLEATGRLDVLRLPAQFRNFTVDDQSCE